MHHRLLSNWVTREKLCLRNGDRLVTMTSFLSQLVIAFPTVGTYESLYPLRGLLAISGCVFHFRACYAHQLPRNLAHGFRLVTLYSGANSSTSLPDLPSLHIVLAPKSLYHMRSFVRSRLGVRSGRPMTLALAIPFLSNSTMLTMS